MKDRSGMNKPVVHPIIFDVVRVDIDTGKDDLMATAVRGCLVIRGPAAEMRYVPPGQRPGDAQTIQQFAGSLFFGDDFVFDYAVMDVDRDHPCICWVVLTSQSKPGLLLYELGADGLFRRIGSGIYQQDVKVEHFH
jgi:hypothetical protein